MFLTNIYETVVVKNITIIYKYRSLVTFSIRDAYMQHAAHAARRDRLHPCAFSLAGVPAHLKKPMLMFFLGKIRHFGPVLFS
jgi:hypothetical protein